MNLLLLLSALLSALTGASQGARPAQLAVAVAQAAEPVAASRRTAPNVGARPEAGLPRLPLDLLSPAWAIAPAAPLFLSRRRE